MPLGEIALYRRAIMHGLRCSPALLGWTRLLDEWVVGLTRYNRTSPSEPACWEDEARTLSTLADAATRVRSFAYREVDIEPTEPRPDHTLCFELQGCVYRVAVAQQSPASPDVITAAPDWLGAALGRAAAVANPDEHAVGAIFVTPALRAGLPEAERQSLANSFIAASRSVPSTGCAYSFPSSAELDRYRYGNSQRPGALLLVQASEPTPQVST